MLITTSVQSIDRRILFVFGSLLAAGAIWGFCAANAAAEPFAQPNTVLEETVNDLCARGDHFNAILKHRRQASAKTAKPLSEHLAAAQSAWALGLVETARTLWDEALADRALEGNERVRAILSRAILEIQEGNYNAARALAERTLPRVKEPALSAQLYLVAAEALKSQAAYSQAERYYLEAVERADGSAKNEAYYLLGENQFALGVLHSARKSFAAVEVDSRHAAKALRRLVEIDLHEQNFIGALNWIGRGRDHYAVEFEDPWIRYVAISSFIAADRFPEAKKELAAFGKWYEKEEPWHVLSRAAVESAEASNRYLRGRLQRSGGGL